MFRKNHHQVPGRFYCALCRETVDLTTAKTDEDGQAIHEDCYMNKICEKTPSKAQKPPEEHD